MLRILLIGLMIVTSLNIGADDVVNLKKNSPAPFDGVLFTVKRTNEIRAELIEFDATRVQLKANEKQLQLHQQIIKLKTEEIELFRTQNHKLVVANKSAKTMNYIAFGLGILATSLVYRSAR